MLQTLAICLIAFATGVVAGIDMAPRFFATEESIEYISDDMEIVYMSSGTEIIHDVAQVEVGENFVIMLDREKNVKVIIPNREIERIKSIRKDVE